MDGVAASAFRYHRIGFRVLPPPATAAALDCGLELAVFLTAPEEELGRLAGLLGERDPVVRVLVFDETKEATPRGYRADGDG